MSDRVELPKSPALAGKVIDAQAKERGMLGNIVGTKDHAPTNIAAVAVVLLIVLLAALLFMPVADGVDRSGILTAVLSAVTFILGLLFGRGSSEK